MQHFAKPENALNRARELCALGSRPQKEAAMVALHDVLSSKRHRTWQPAMEEVMIAFLDLSVELRRGKAAKDGLIAYRIICQQINVASMEAVLRHFMDGAEKANTAAMAEAEVLLDSQAADLLDFEDLEAEETPESLMLATIGGAADSRKRIERQQVTPSLKFLWEAFRTVLDILRNNQKLEDLYKDTALRAFDFCTKYKRTIEFRRLCEILRYHIQARRAPPPHLALASSLSSSSSLSLFLLPPLLPAAHPRPPPPGRAGPGQGGPQVERPRADHPRGAAGTML